MDPSGISPVGHAVNTLALSIYWQAMQARLIQLSLSTTVARYVVSTIRLGPS